MKYRMESLNLDGCGHRACRVYAVAPVAGEYWSAVTDVTCPGCGRGHVRWAEAGYVPGYRICDRCGGHYLARGNSANPTLIRFPGCRSARTRRGPGAIEKGE